MHLAPLFSYLSSLHPISKELTEDLTKELRILVRPRNYLLLQSPQVATEAYFLNKGFAISYSYGEDGRKITEVLWKPGQIVLPFKSFFEQVPSQQTIQLVQRSELLSMGHISVMRLLEVYPEAQRIYQLLLNRNYQHSLERIQDMQQLSAAQRFEKLLRDYPGIQQLISQDAIASYLGIAAQSLSRLKRDDKKS